MAKAIRDCAFDTSQQPVMLSLEMHCTLKQRRILANLMVEHLGDLLISYDELSRAAETSPLSPLDLQHRVMAKGKVKPAKEKHASPPRVPRLACSLTSKFPSLRDTLQGSSLNADDTKATDRTGSKKKSFQLGANTRNSISSYYRPASRRTRLSVTDEVYTSLLALRSVPVQLFMTEAPQPWVLPITSVNEDRLLALLGLRVTQRNQIEGLVGLQTGRRTSGAGGGIGPADELNAVARLASDPPQEVGHVQRRTAKWLLRP